MRKYIYYKEYKLKYYQEHREEYLKRSKERNEKIKSLGIKIKRTEYKKRPSTDPNSDKNRRLKQKFGITLEQYEEILSKQNGLCAICSSTEKTGKRLAVDHCHKTGKVRGILCMKCNTSLGKINDDISILEKMIFYLKS